VRLVLSWTRGRKGPIVPWGGEGIWRRTRGFLESRTHRSFSILHNSERWSAESWWRLFLKSGLGLFSCNPRFVFFPVLPRASSRLWPAAPVLRSLPSSLPTGRLLRQAILNQLKQHHWPLHANSFQKNAPSSTHSRLRHPTTTPPSLHESRLIVASTRHARGLLHGSSA
jgi:hypothetical protein